MRVSRSQKLSSRRIDLTWLVFFIFCRGLAVLFGVKFDGIRVVENFMQFPSIDLLNPANTWNILLNFHFAPPGLPILFILLEAFFQETWEFVAWGSFSFLGFVAGLAIIRIFDDRKVVGLGIAMLFIGINPSILLFEAQFYSTAITSYMLCILAWEIKCNQGSRFSYVRKSFLVFLLALIRPSILPVFAIAFIGYFSFRQAFRSNFPGKKIMVGIVVTTCLLPLSLLQGERVAKFSQISFSSAGVTGTIYSLMNYGELSGLDYARPGYSPFVDMPNIATRKISGNPILDSEQKSNGLPNWNSLSNLSDYRLDQKHFLEVLSSNPRLLGKLLIHSMAWVSTNPACSRILDQSNYDAVRIADAIYRHAIYLEAGTLTPNQELFICGGKSGVQLAYLLLLAIFLLLLPFQIFLKVRKRPNKHLELIGLGLIVYMSILLSLLNGSAEISKYRMETELFMIVYVLSALSTQKSLVFKFFKDRRRAIL